MKETVKGQKTLKFGNTNIQYSIEYSPRKTMGITVTPEMEVLVKAPVDADVEVINKKLKKRAAWIIKQQNFFHSFYPKMPQRRYVNGETHLYMGRQYRLQVIQQESTTKDRVKLIGGFLKVYTTEKTEVETLVKAWYRDKANSRLKEIAQPLLESFVKRHNISNPNVQISIREMPNRWGSCTPKGRIILNPELIKAPRGCIEYVVVHELCHLIYHDHTKNFFELQNREMKDWEKWKMKLEKLLA